MGAAAAAVAVGGAAVGAAAAAAEVAELLIVPGVCEEYLRVQREQLRRAQLTYVDEEVMAELVMVEELPAAFGASAMGRCMLWCVLRNV